MSDFIKYSSSENETLFTKIISQISEFSEIVLSTKAAINLVRGFASEIDNRAALYYDKQVYIRETHKEFRVILNYLKMGSDTRSVSSYSFCNRVYSLSETDSKVRAMSFIVSCVKRDSTKAIEHFSNIEGAMIDESLISMARMKKLM
jgi:hypothetical protein